MSISGHIQTVSLHGVMQLLCSESKTGILRVSSNKVEFQIYMLKGNILYAIQSYKEARLGRLLVRDGVVTEETIKACVAEAKRQKKAIGKVLVDDGYITSKTLEKYIYEQILEIITTIFSWTEGEFSYQDMAYNLRWLVVVRINTLQLIMEALRRVDELNDAVVE